MNQQHRLNKNQVRYILENSNSNLYTVIAKYPLYAIYSRIKQDPVIYFGKDTWKQTMYVVVTDSEIEKLKANDYYSNSVLKITSRHLDVMNTFVNHLDTFFLSKNKKKYPSIMLDKKDYDKEQLEYLHTMRINGKLSTKGMLAVQIRSMVDISMLNLFGIKFNTAMLYV